MADVKEVRKEGEWYRVRGTVDGRSVDAHVPAPAVESLSRADADKLFKRSVQRIADAERDHGRS